MITYKDVNKIKKENPGLFLYNSTILDDIAYCLYLNKNFLFHDSIFYIQVGFISSVGCDEYKRLIRFYKLEKIKNEINTK